MRAERAAALLDFLAVADRLKTVERRGRVVLPDGTTVKDFSDGDVNNGDDFVLAVENPEVTRENSRGERRKA